MKRDREKERDEERERERDYTYRKQQFSKHPPIKRHI